MIRNEIKKIIQRALESLQKSGALSAQELPEIRVEYPNNPTLGDYSTNIAFLLSSNEKQQPGFIAPMISEKIESSKEAQKMFEKVEAAGAGFINFTLAKKFLQDQLHYARYPILHINAGRGKKLNIEFLSANPTGKFQVGNGRLGFYGDVLGNIFTLARYKVTKEYYLNNAQTSNQIQELGKTALGLGSKYLTPYVQEKIRKMPKRLKAIREKYALIKEAGFFLAREIHKDNKKFLKKIGIHFDIFTEEEELYKKGSLEKTLHFLEKRGLVYEKDGAQWLKTTQFGDDKDKVLVREDGEYGYYLGDIAYHADKIKRGYKTIVDIFGADHQGHVNPMKIAMKILGYGGKFDILVSQLVQAKGGGKFSKRAGNAILLEDLIAEVGVDVARYFYLMKSLDTQMEFDMDLAKEQSEKNPVYYIQYAHARMSSILRRAQGFPTSPSAPLSLTHPSEFNLMKHLLHWPEVIEDTVYDYELQRVTTYAYELAAVFNQFYRDCRVISKDEDLTNVRLRLVVVTQKVLKEVFWALGISAPEKM